MSAVAIRLDDTTYPGADVTVQCLQNLRPRVVVTTRDAEGRILHDDATALAESEIEEAVLEIARNVWDAGEFWTEAEPH